MAGLYKAQTYVTICHQFIHYIFTLLLIHLWTIYVTYIGFSRKNSILLFHLVLEPFFSEITPVSLLGFHSYSSPYSHLPSLRFKNPNLFFKKIKYIKTILNYNSFNISILKKELYIKKH